MPKKFETYLAGAFCPSRGYSDWRDMVLEKVDNDKISFYDPRIKSNQLCPATFTMDDAKGVVKSDILFHYRTRGYEDEGASWEHGIAFACNLLNNKRMKVKKKLIIYVDDTNIPFPLNFASANLTFSNLQISIKFLNSLRSLEKKDFMPYYMKLLNREREG